MDNRAIGIFDSGFGGLTVMSEIAKLMPNENLLYFGDSAHVPYGSKSPETIIRFSKNISAFLFSKNIKALVIACNTASTFALNPIKKTLPIPVIGVIEPGAKAAVKVSRQGRIGIIGTEGTIAGGAYEKTIKKISKAKVFSQACPLFVPLIEEDWANSKPALDIARIYLEPLIDKKIDTLVLGCTHYPLMKSILRRVAGENIVLIDSASAVALEVRDVLVKNSLTANPKNKGKTLFFASDNPSKFQTLANRFFHTKISPVKKITLE